MFFFSSKVFYLLLSPKFSHAIFIKINSPFTNKAEKIKVLNSFDEKDFIDKRQTRKWVIYTRK